METKGNGRFYITTPIYYPNDRLHVGHAYTTTLADSLARYNRMAGRDVLFLTGSDEHGQKLQRAAEERGQAPKEYVDAIVATFQELWRRLGISYDDFIRTTDPRHVKVVQEIFEKVYAKGDIYKGEYEGWYCTPDEAFWLERQLVDGKCPQCGRQVERVREESYFFRLSSYQDRLVDHIRSHPEFIQPDSRRNEVLKFIEQGLEDLSISRTSFEWGIPIPRDPKHVIYVWFDALSNYLTGAGYLQDEAKFQKFWPADLHLVGKEIIRFHCIIWPAMLMALDLPLPRTVFGHGWLVMGGDKMSKSKGNVVDPIALIDEFGADALRYFLLREISFGSDGNFSREALIQRINSDLANDLGNLIYRTSSMLQRYFGGRVPAPGDPDEVDRALAALAMETVNRYREQMEIYEMNGALSSIWQLVGRANKYIDEKAPWNLAKNEENQPRLARVMYNLVEVIRMVALMVFPFMPATGRKIWVQLSLPGEIEAVGLAACSWGRLPVGVEVKHEDPLFPRIEVKAEETPANQSQPEKQQAPKVQAALVPQPAAPQAREEGAGLISIDDFGKVDLRVGTIRQAERIQGADKLLKLKVDLGEGRERQIVAGIALYYSPEDLPGRQVVVVSNLKPAKLRGELSEGMLLAASTPEKGQVILVSPHNPIAPGSRVK